MKNESEAAQASIRRQVHARNPDRDEGRKTRLKLEHDWNTSSSGRGTIAFSSQFFPNFLGMNQGSPVWELWCGRVCWCVVCVSEFPKSRPLVWCFIPETDQDALLQVQNNRWPSFQGDGEKNIMKQKFKRYVTLLIPLDNDLKSCYKIQPIKSNGKTDSC